MSKISLNTRLLASYMLLLLITLGVIATALFLLFSARPAAPQATYEHLGGVMQGLSLTNYLPDRQNLTYESITQALQNVAKEQDVRVIFADISARPVLFDSSGVYTSDDLQDFNQRLLFDNTQSRALPGYNRVAGSFTDPDGQQWLFVGLVQERLLGTGVLLLAERRPTQSLVASLRDLGASFALPMIQAGLIGFAVAVLLAFLITRSIVRPLQHVAEAAVDVAQGYFNTRVPEGGPPEVRAVGVAFNRMSSEVLSTQNAQRDFLANVSHDLKTPLTSIQGYSQAIIDGAAKDPGEAAKIIYDEATRLNRMVIELTDLARIQAGRLSMQSSAIDMGEMTAAIAHRLEVVAQRKGVHFTVNAGSLPPVAGDGDRLAQVLTNLISNAIKYTPEGGSVEITTRIAKNGVEVAVADTGIGIPQEDLPRIFERFYQVDKARGPRRGTGLGLAITQEIVQAHGGNITVMSAGRGHGSTFVLWLPSPQVSTVVRRK